MGGREWGGGGSVQWGRCAGFCLFTYSYFFHPPPQTLFSVTSISLFLPPSPPQPPPARTEYWRAIKMASAALLHVFWVTTMKGSIYINMRVCVSVFARAFQVWFQNRRSKERRMKQLSALGARRHAFFRSPRRMRTLVDRLEPGELIPNGPFSYYGGRPEPAIIYMYIYINIYKNIWW